MVCEDKLSLGCPAVLLLYSSQQGQKLNYWQFLTSLLVLLKSAIPVSVHILLFNMTITVHVAPPEIRIKSSISLIPLLNWGGFLGICCKRIVISLLYKVWTEFLNLFVVFLFQVNTQRYLKARVERRTKRNVNFYEIKGNFPLIISQFGVSMPYFKINIANKVLVGSVLTWRIVEV